MALQPAPPLRDLNALPGRPRWIPSGRAQTPESVAFRSGAALVVLDQLIAGPCRDLPVRLFANRLALTAATATSKLEGRLARQADIRDAYHLTPPGAARGPDGDLLAFWRAAVRARPDRPDQTVALTDPALAAAQDDWLGAGQDRARAQGPLAGCASVLCAALTADDRSERVACLLSDIVLARALGWPFLLPVTAQRLSAPVLRDIVARRAGAGLAVQARILESLEDMIRLARDLARRAAALRSVAPGLRAKGSAAAVDLFLTEEAVAPASMLSPVIRGTATRMTGRAARRFCDRLVGLGVACELTGRPTFRLYGLVP